MVGVVVTTFLEPSHNDNGDDVRCPWYFISTKKKNENWISLTARFIPKTLFLAILIGKFPLSTLMQSFHTASLVGTGISIHAKFDLVENNGADFSCNISTGLGIEVDINVIVLIRSSINVIQTQDVCVWLYF